MSEEYEYNDPRMGCLGVVLLVIVGNVVAFLIKNFFLICSSILYIPLYLWGLLLAATTSGAMGSWRYFSMNATSATYASILFWVALIFFIAWPRAYSVAVGYLAGAIGFAIFSSLVTVLYSLSGETVTSFSLMWFVLWAGILLLVFAGFLATLLAGLAGWILAAQQTLRLLEPLSKKAPLFVRPWWIPILLLPWLMLFGSEIHTGIHETLPHPIVNFIAFCIFWLCFALSFNYTDESVDFNRIYSRIDGHWAAQERTFLAWIPFVRKDGKDSILFLVSVIFLSLYWVMASLLPQPDWGQLKRLALYLVDLVPAIYGGQGEKLNLLAIDAEGMLPTKTEWFALAPWIAGAIGVLLAPVRFLRFAALGAAALLAFAVFRWWMPMFLEVRTLGMWISLAAMPLLGVLGFLAIKEVVLLADALDRILFRLPRHFFTRIFSLVIFFLALSALEPDATVPPPQQIEAVTGTLLLCFVVGLSVMAFAPKTAELRSSPLTIYLLRLMLKFLHWFWEPFGSFLKKRKENRFRKEREIERKCEETRLQKEREEKLREEARLQKEREEEQKRKAEEKERKFQELLATGKIRERCSEPLAIVYSCSNCGNRNDGEKWAEENACPDCGGEEKRILSSQCKSCHQNCEPTESDRKCHSIKIYQAKEKLIDFKNTK